MIRRITRGWIRCWERRRIFAPSTETAARLAGIRVILDGVCSATRGTDSRYFNRGGPVSGRRARTTPPPLPIFRLVYICGAGRTITSELVGRSTPCRRWRRPTPALSGLICWERRASCGAGCGRGAAGWRLDVADELPDGFLDRAAAGGQGGEPGGAPAGRGVGGRQHQAQLRRAGGGILLGRQLDSGDELSLPRGDSGISAGRGGRRTFVEHGDDRRRSSILKPGGATA